MAATGREPSGRALYVKPSDVAAENGISLGTVYALIRSGELTARRIRRQWRIPIDAYEAWKRAREEGGQ